MKILVAYRAIHDTAGGVERMSSLIMNEMAGRGHEIRFVTLDPEDAVSFYALDDSIVWLKLGIGDPASKASWKVRFERIQAFRTIFKEFRPDVVLAFQEASFLTACIAATGLNIPVIAAERNSPSRFSFLEVGKRQLAFTSFRFAKFITVQCESYRRHYPRSLQSKLEVLPNPIFPQPDNKTPKKNIVLSVGRLSYQKNFACLIQAFSKISGLCPEWKLVIAGEGEDRKSLEDMILKFGLQERIELPGASAHLEDHYKTAKLFCLPSRWEGFPNALGEALAHGLPSVGFDDCDGVRDLIGHGYSGLLAEGNGDADSLSMALKKLIEDEGLREEMAGHAVLSIRPYEPAAIFDRWERLLKEAAG